MPQKRERLFFVCFRKELEVKEFSFPEPIWDDVALEDILMSEGDSRLDDLFIERDDLRMSNDLPVVRENRPLRIGTVGKGGQGERVYSVKGHAITLSAFGEELVRKQECISWGTGCVDYIHSNVRG